MLIFRRIKQFHQAFMIFGLLGLQKSIYEYIYIYVYLFICLPNFQCIYLAKMTIPSLAVHKLCLAVKSDIYKALYDYPSIFHFEIYSSVSIYQLVNVHLSISTLYDPFNENSFHSRLLTDQNAETTQKYL